MKISKYNLVIQKEGRKYVYNQLRSSLLEVDEELSQLLSMSNENIVLLDKELRDDLLANGMICEDGLNEENVILASSKKQRFGNDTARVTILPTLNCNFHCWYCYEKHLDSKMKADDITKVISFCRDIICNGSVKNFHLDWFGGEPLMYFDEIVFPISVAVKEICHSCNVIFRNSITTNGYFINLEMIRRMNEIDLKSFQITLDGGKQFHNKTRFSAKEKNSYDVIVRNIVRLFYAIPDIRMLVRINYTPKNIDSIEDIAESFPDDVRPKIEIIPQLVWQFKENVNLMESSLKKKMETFIKKGYRRSFARLGCVLCYAENMNQYVINYNLLVYKCTARDFSEKYAIGVLDENGKFLPKPYYYDYFIASSFENPKCLSCHLLPSCLGTCVQRHMENIESKCDKEDIENSIRNKILLYIEQTEKLD